MSMMNARRVSAVAEHVTAVSCRNDVVPNDVSAHDPEIDQRVAEIPKEHAREHHVDAGRPSKRPRNQQPHLGDDAERRDDPHDERRRRAEDDQRNRLIRDLFCGK